MTGVRGTVLLDEPERNWNPRYLNYARAHGRAPRAMIDADRARYPGAPMHGFLIWVDRRWREFRWAHGIGPRDILDGHDHKRFDRWLDIWMPVGT